ncbi:hypothetical protein [Metabacillus litoralis]|uniref:Core-binding (CB) domain-containing protein n=1 Tax=Metabacillus litoralis TaxID=152268 RepID=A0A179SXR4_9BACI|nr:hypothetical protein [Metabacillus litoralis]OAS85092.1 hypothetical protein A6K24_06165 [Metabacillus litoralis]
MQKLHFYNEEIKQEFLEKYSDETKRTYSSLFRKVSEHEIFADKDLFDFNFKQLEMLMKRLDFNNANGAKTYGRIISSYLNWAIEKGLRKEENPLKNIGNEWFEESVNEIKLFISEEELIKFENKLVNFQDKVILRLIFEGVGGFQLTELTNLTINDLNGNILHLNDNKHGERFLTVSDRAINFIKAASKELEYYTRNGNSTSKRTVSPLVENEYVIKSTINKNVINIKAVDRHQIYRRLSMIEEIFSLKDFNAKSYEKSGMIKMGKDLYLEYGKLEDEELQKIAERFNVKKIKIAGEYKYNYLTLKEFVNIENVKNLYNID